MSSHNAEARKFAVLFVSALFVVGSCGSGESAKTNRLRNSALDCYADQQTKDAAVELLQVELDANELAVVDAAAAASEAQIAFDDADGMFKELDAEFLGLEADFQRAEQAFNVAEAAHAAAVGGAAKSAAAHARNEARRQMDDAYDAMNQAHDESEMANQEAMTAHDLLMDALALQSVEEGNLATSQSNFDAVNAKTLCESSDIDSAGGEGSTTTSAVLDSTTVAAAEDLTSATSVTSVVQVDAESAEDPECIPEVPMVSIEPSSGIRTGSTVTMTAQDNCGNPLALAFVTNEQWLSGYTNTPISEPLCWENPDDNELECSGFDAGTWFAGAAIPGIISMDEVGYVQFEVTEGGEPGDCDDLELLQVGDSSDLQVTGCSGSLVALSIAGLSEDILSMSDGKIIATGLEDLPAGSTELEYEALFSDGSYENGMILECWVECDWESTEFSLDYEPENPSVGENVYFSINGTESCGDVEWGWSAYNERGDVFSGHPFSYAFIPSQVEKYRIVARATCLDNSEVQIETEILPLHVAGQPHDYMANPWIISGSSGSVESSTLGTTREIGEPMHTDCEWESDATAWHRWTAPESGHLAFISSYLTVVAMYESPSGEGGLVRTPRSFDSDWNAHFEVVRGTTYLIAITGWYRENFGPYSFSWELTPSSAEDRGLFGPAQTDNYEPMISEAAQISKISTTESGVTTMVIGSDVDQLIFSEFDLEMLRDLAGVQNGMVSLQLDNGQVIPLSNFGTTKIRLDDTENLKVLVQGAKIQDALIHLERSSKSAVESSNATKSGGMNQLIVVLIVLGALVLLGWTGTKLRKTKN